MGLYLPRIYNNIILLKNGAHADYLLMEIESETVLFGAILRCDEMIIRLLVDYSADINVMDINGSTLLYCAL